MSNHRSRGYSPTRYYGDQPRATTGTVYVTSFDTAARGGPPQPRSSVSTSSSGRHSVAYQAQPMKSTRADGKTTTRYAVRPRQDSTDPSDSRRPLSISTRDSSPPRRSQYAVASPREDSSRLLQPASSHGNHHSGSHHRHNSTSMADLEPRDSVRDRRERSYHPRPPYVQRLYHEDRPSSRPSEDDEWSYTGPREQFDRDYPPQRPSETRETSSRKERPADYYAADRPLPRRDLAPPTSSSRHHSSIDGGKHDRHGSKSGYESDPDRISEAPRRRHSTRQPVLHQQHIRDDGYSSARDDHDSRSQQKHRDDRRDKEHKSWDRQRDSYRESERDRDYDRKYHREPDRERPRDSARSYGRHSDRDHERDYDQEYERGTRDADRRRKPRSRESSPERSSFKSLATGALSSLAAAGVVKGLSREHKDKDKDKDKDKEKEKEEKDKDKDTEQDDDEQKERRHKKHRHRSKKDDQHDDSDRERGQYEDERGQRTDEQPHRGNERTQRGDERPHRRYRDGSGSDPSEDMSPKRRHSHRRHKEDEEKPSERSAPTDTEAAREPSKGRLREENEAHSDTDRDSRALVPVHKQDREEEPLEPRTMSPGENEDDRPRRVQLVEPLKEKEEVRPRGILKPARQVPFPEDPNPVREGVAPLKDATKDGIPPNARWTKINRALVNPEALEKAHERFEERDDYVIVLRVLTRDEIKKLADKTTEIRDAREREWQQQLKERQRKETAGPSESIVSDGEVNYNRDRSKPLAIEGPSTEQGPPVDFHNLANAPNQSTASGASFTSAPVADTNVEDNYSQNV